MTNFVNIVNAKWTLFKMPAYFIDKSKIFTEHGSGTLVKLCWAAELWVLTRKPTNKAITSSQN